MILPQIIDTRFLTLHPRTELWWKQRELCERCVHLLDNRETEGGMVCTGIRGRCNDSCINAREPGRICGPTGKMFEERVWDAA